MPNRPIATTPIFSPSNKFVDPKVKRAAPEVTSMPTRPTTMPITTEVSECTADARPSTAAPVMPSTTRAKYSGEPNDSATLASGGANSARMMMPTALPHSDAIVALTCHRISVQTFDRGDRMRNVEQKRPGNGAIHGAVVQAGQHD